jgi:hypothetical protein
VPQDSHTATALYLVQKHNGRAIQQLARNLHTPLLATRDTAVAYGRTAAPIHHQHTRLAHVSLFPFCMRIGSWVASVCVCVRLNVIRTMPQSLSLTLSVCLSRFVCACGRTDFAEAPVHDIGDAKLIGQ